MKLAENVRVATITVRQFSVFSALTSRPTFIEGQRLLGQMVEAYGERDYRRREASELFPRSMRRRRR